jgi:hypothetical protein
MGEWLYLADMRKEHRPAAISVNLKGNAVDRCIRAPKIPLYSEVSGGIDSSVGVPSIEALSIAQAARIAADVQILIAAEHIHSILRHQRKREEPQKNN